jgi:predicted nucleic acid-binding protein
MFLQPPRSHHRCHDIDAQVYKDVGIWPHIDGTAPRCYLTDQPQGLAQARIQVLLLPSQALAAQLVHLVAVNLREIGAITSGRKVSTWYPTESGPAGYDVAGPGPCCVTVGVIAVCPVVELEFLCSARSLADRLAKRRLLREVFGWVPMSERVDEGAEAVQQMLTEAGMHRSAGPVDLLIAATAEREPLTVLCDDHDYKVVASVTGQLVKLVTDVTT